MNRKSYPSDVSDKEWAFVAAYLALISEEAPQRVYGMAFISLSKMLILSILFLSCNGFGNIPAQNPFDAGINTLNWSPDGSKVAYSGGYSSCDPDSPTEFQVYIVDSATYQPLVTLSGFLCPVTSIDWSPDGSKIAAASLDGHGLRVWDSNSGELISSLARGSQGVSAVKWNPDGESLAVGFMSNGASIISPLTGETINIPPIGGMYVDWSPAGDKLLSGSESETSLFVSDINTHTIVLELTGNELPVTDLAWSADGTQIASAGIDASVRIWNSESGNLLFTFSHSSEVAALAWHPYAHRLASVGFDHLIKVWDTNTGLLVEQFSLPNVVYDIAWKPDGSALAYVDGSESIHTIEPSPLPTATPTKMLTPSNTPTNTLAATPLAGGAS